jgi:hypothetical protein
MIQEITDEQLSLCELLPDGTMPTRIDAIGEFMLMRGWSPTDVADMVRTAEPAERADWLKPATGRHAIIDGELCVVWLDGADTWRINGPCPNFAYLIQ